MKTHSLTNKVFKAEINNRSAIFIAFMGCWSGALASATSSLFYFKGLI